MSYDHKLPDEHRALRLHAVGQDLVVEKVPTPQAIPGSAVIRILSVNIISYMGDVFSGKRRYPFPTPFTPGTNAIGRIATVGADATSLEAGQLVLFDCFIRSRDEPDHRFLHGLYEGDSKGSARLMRDTWRDSTFAEYALVPLENCHVLDEKRLLGDPAEQGLGYKVDELCCMASIVPYGGLRDIGLQPGETVIISPATGQFGSAGVSVALAMGARVIAMGRNMDTLKELQSRNERVDIVQITNNTEEEMRALSKFGTIDAFLDISPPMAQKSTHVKSAIRSLRNGGRVSLMSGFLEDIEIPFRYVMHQDITIKGKWMYSRKDIKDIIKLVETGLLKLGEKGGFHIRGKFALEDWRQALDVAKANAGPGDLVVFNP